MLLEETAHKPYITKLGLGESVAKRESNLSRRKERGEGEEKRRRGMK